MKFYSFMKYDAVLNTLFIKTTQENQMKQSGRRSTNNRRIENSTGGRRTSAFGGRRLGASDRRSGLVPVDVYKPRRSTDEKTDYKLTYQTALRFAGELRKVINPSYKAPGEGEIGVVTDEAIAEIRTLRATNEEAQRVMFRQTGRIAALLGRVENQHQELNEKQEKIRKLVDRPVTTRHVEVVPAELADAINDLQSYMGGWPRSFVGVVRFAGHLLAARRQDLDAALNARITADKVCYSWRDRALGAEKERDEAIEAARNAQAALAKVVR